MATRRLVAYLSGARRDMLAVLADLRGLTASATIGELIGEQYAAAFGSTNPADARTLARRMADGGSRYIKRADGVVAGRRKDLR